MKLGLMGRIMRSATALAVAMPLAVSVAGAAPVAAVTPSIFCVAAAPNIWVIPLTSQTQYYLPGQTRVFRVSIRNNMSCAGLPWSVDSFITSSAGHVWGDVPGGPTSGVVPASSTISTSFLVTAPPGFFSGKADLYIRVHTPLSAPGFHWTMFLTD